MPALKKNLEKYLSLLFKAQVKVTSLREFKKDEAGGELKGFGYGKPILIEFTHNGEGEKVVLHTMSADPFGHERPSDRASCLLLDHDTFNRMPKHTQSLDVGVFAKEGELISLGDAGEFFLLTKYAPGQLYAGDLQCILKTGELMEGDEKRALALADYLAEIHARKKSAPELYRRRIRDLIGHGEGIMGLTDSYPSDFELASREFLEEVERECVAWRWQIKEKVHRLSQVHGDFHPFNVLFREGTDFTLLDHSRGEWGEPADDLSAMSINYIFFSLQRKGDLSGPFERLFRVFWERYLELTSDQEALSVIQPFYAWRALVLASPIWYPNLAPKVRRKLFNFTENVLTTEIFDLYKVNGYLN